MVGTAPGGSEATLWLVGKGLEPAWQREKQRRVACLGSLNKGGWGREDMASGLGSPAPFHYP